MYALCQYLHCIEPRLGSLWIYPLYPTVLVWKARLELACSIFFIFYFEATFKFHQFLLTLWWARPWSTKTNGLSGLSLSPFTLSKLSILSIRGIQFFATAGVWARILALLGLYIKTLSTHVSTFFRLALTSQSLWIHKQTWINVTFALIAKFTFYVFSSTWLESDLSLLHSFSLLLSSHLLLLCLLLHTAIRDL